MQPARAHTAQLAVMYAIATGEPQLLLCHITPNLHMIKVVPVSKKMLCHLLLAYPAAAQTKLAVHQQHQACDPLCGICVLNPWSLRKSQQAHAARLRILQLCS
jgi:hypothetical protein